MNVHQVFDTLESTGRKGGDAHFAAHLQRLREVVGDDLVTLENELPTYLQESVYPLAETGRHLVEAGGKRVRPVLTLLSAHATGGQGAQARSLAAAGELVHLATLLHDDVIDDAPRRRNAPTPRVVWSNTASVLGGDYALTRALDIVAHVDSPFPLREATATLRALVEGELLQAALRGRAQVSEAEYFAVAERKTASLFSWCCRAGAHMAGTPSEVEALGRFGHALGICFQIVDDVLDFAAEGDAFGKELLTDLQEGKATLPVIHAIELRPELQATLQALSISKGTTPAREDLLALSQAIRECGALDRARAQAHQLARSAEAELEHLRPSPSRDALRTIASSLALRVS